MKKDFENQQNFWKIIFSFVKIPEKILGWGDKTTADVKKKKYVYIYIYIYIYKNNYTFTTKYLDL